MRLAACCWITKSSGPSRRSGSAGAGSGVALKVRLAAYSPSDEGPAPRDRRARVSLI